MDVHSHGVVGELVCVDEPARQLVIRICREPVVNEELGLGIQRLGIALDQAIDLGARRLRARHSVGAGKSGHILSEAVTGNKAVKIVFCQTEAGEVVPSAHVFPGSRQTGNLAKDFQQTVVVQVQKAGVQLVELPLHPAILQADIRVWKRRQGRINGARAFLSGG